MGITGLATFIKNRATEQSVREIHLQQLRGRVVVVDASIYLYKFKADNMLIPHMYLMLTIFRTYGIRAIFVFDGKPPVDKADTLRLRAEAKCAAQQEYSKQRDQTKEDGGTSSLEERHRLSRLRKACTRISYKNVRAAKGLLEAFGVSWFDATGEADGVCAQLVRENKAWACMTDDTDLFAYGCTRVIRNFDVIHHTGVIYHLSGILHDLNMHRDAFCKACILAGTDYNVQSGAGSSISNNLPSIEQIFGAVVAYDNRMWRDGDIPMFEWVCKHLYVDMNINVEDLYHTHAIFARIEEATEHPGASYDADRVSDIMRAEDFIYASSLTISSSPDADADASGSSSDEGEASSTPASSTSTSTSPSSSLSSSSSSMPAIRAL